jgi:hypothetical protein
MTASEIDFSCSESFLTHDLILSWFKTGIVEEVLSPSFVFISCGYYKVESLENYFS